MIPSSLQRTRSRAILHLTVGLGLSLISVPAAMAVTTAIATASLSFNLSSPNGTVGISSANLNGTADLNAGPPASAHSYWNTGAATSFAASESLGNNSFVLSSSVSGRSFGASSGVSLAVPPFLTAEGTASSFNFVSIDTSQLISANDMYELKFSAVRARLDVDLGTDADGVAAFGGASWFVGLRYALPGDTDGGSNTWSLSRNIGTDDTWSDTNNYTGSFSFTGIPAAATNIQLYWETTAEARAVDGGRSALPVPDGGTTIILFSSGLGALAWMRRKVRPLSPA
jgi:hypothetical protein